MDVSAAEIIFLSGVVIRYSQQRGHGVIFVCMEGAA